MFACIRRAFPLNGGRLTYAILQAAWDYHLGICPTVPGKNLRSGRFTSCRRCRQFKTSFGIEGGNCDYYFGPRTGTTLYFQVSSERKDALFHADKTESTVLHHICF